MAYKYSQVNQVEPVLTNYGFIQNPTGNNDKGYLTWVYDGSRDDIVRDTKTSVDACP